MTLQSESIPSLLMAYRLCGWIILCPHSDVFAVFKLFQSKHKQAVYHVPPRLCNPVSLPMCPRLHLHTHKHTHTHTHTNTHTHTHTHKHTRTHKHIHVHTHTHSGSPRAATQSERVCLSKCDSFICGCQPVRSLTRVPYSLSHSTSRCIFPLILAKKNLL